MKFSIIVVSLLAVVFVPSCTMANFVAQINTPDDVTTDPVKACERETNMDDIEEKLNEAILEMVDGVSVDDSDNHDSDRRLNSRFGGVRSSCVSLCWGIREGLCHYIFPHCWNLRRQLEAEESEKGNPEVEDRMLSLDDFLVEEERGVKCAQTAIVSEAVFEELAHAAETDECRAALLAKNKQYTCYNILGPKL